MNGFLDYGVAAGTRKVNSTWINSDVPSQAVETHLDCDVTPAEGKKRPNQNR